MNKTDNSNIKLLNGRIFEEKGFSDIRAVLEQVFQDLDLDEKIKDYKILQEWDFFSSDKLSPSVQKYTFAHRISKDRKVVIGVRSAVIANELQLSKVIIEKNFLETIKSFNRGIKGLVFELRS